MPHDTSSDGELDASIGKNMGNAPRHGVLQAAATQSRRRASVHSREQRFRKISKQSQCKGTNSGDIAHRLQPGRRHSLKPSTSVMQYPSCGKRKGRVIPRNEVDASSP
ncbi:hypothetical protein RRF57_013152 [Xylaria bambusicola]|uniref:Uncharacterized protein n=1 Tax=Xylaria bambusicola TaxID=326684 RepID=A0AAN7UWD5_9PEZI